MDITQPITNGPSSVLIINFSSISAPSPYFLSPYHTVLFISIYFILFLSFSVFFDSGSSILSPLSFSAILAFSGFAAEGSFITVSYTHLIQGSASTRPSNRRKGSFLKAKFSP